MSFNCKKHGLIIPYQDSNNTLKCGLCWKEQEQKNPHHWDECDKEVEFCIVCQQIFMEEIM